MRVFVANRLASAARDFFLLLGLKQHHIQGGRGVKASQTRSLNGCSREDGTDRQDIGSATKEQRHDRRKAKTFVRAYETDNQQT